MKKQMLAFLMAAAISASCVLPAMAITGASIQRTQNAATVVVPGDVPKSSWYWNAASYTLGYGLMSNVNGAFAGNKTITREQIAKSLYRDAVLRNMTIPSLTTALKSITDASSIGSDCKNGMAYCVAVGVMQGNAKHALQPKSLVTRQELATILMRYGLVIGYSTSADAESNMVDSYQDVSGIASWARGGISYCAVNDLMQGDDLGRFNPQNSISRAQFAQILLNLDNKVSAAWSRITK